VTITSTPDRRSMQWSFALSSPLMNVLFLGVLLVILSAPAMVNAADNVVPPESSSDSLPVTAPADNVVLPESSSDSLPVTAPTDNVVPPEFEPGPLSITDVVESYLEPEALAVSADGGFFILRRDSIKKHDFTGEEIEAFEYIVDIQEFPSLTDIRVGAGGTVFVLKQGSTVVTLGSDGMVTGEMNLQGYPVETFMVDPGDQVIAAVGLRYSTRTRKKIAVLGSDGIGKVLWSGFSEGRFIAALCSSGRSTFLAALRYPLGVDPPLSSSGVRSEWVYKIDTSGRLLDRLTLDGITEMEKMTVLPSGGLLFLGSSDLIRTTINGSMVVRIEFPRSNIIDFALEPSGDLLLLDDSPAQEYVGVKRLMAQTWEEERGVLLDPPVEELFNQWGVTGRVSGVMDEALEYEIKASSAGTSEEIRENIGAAVRIYEDLLQGDARKSIKIRLRLAYLYRWYLDQVKKAASLVREAMLLSPQDPFIHLLLADTLEQLPGHRRKTIETYQALPIVLASLGKGSRKLQNHAWISLIAASRVTGLLTEAVQEEDGKPPEEFSPPEFVPQLALQAGAIPPMLRLRLGDVREREASGETVEIGETDPVLYHLFDYFYSETALNGLERFGLGKINWTTERLIDFYHSHSKSLFAPVAGVLIVRRLMESSEEKSYRKGMAPWEDWLKRLYREWPDDPCWLVLPKPELQDQD